MHIIFVFSILPELMRSIETTNDVAAKIEHWFSSNARTLPWRTESTPWGRLVSEFMAQQTQILRVAERWPLMMSRFPTPVSMARSDEQDVLSLWQGLGYYRRAKHLKATAEMIIKEFGGEVPSDVESLVKLPGVGKYTAGAVSSMAFGKREPIVDGNVHRVLCRLFNKSAKPAPDKWTWGMAEKLVKICKTPQLFNEGLMEFGATVCTPKLPSCAECPLQNSCMAFQKGKVDQVPMSKKSVTKKRVHHYSVIIQNGDEIAFEQRGDQGLWAGLWQVPTIESSKKLTKKDVSQQLNLDFDLQQQGVFEHILTHRIVSFTVFSCHGNRESRFSWLKPNTIDELPLATAQRKVLAVHCVT